MPFGELMADIHQEHIDINLFNQRIFFSKN